MATEYLWDFGNGKLRQKQIPLSQYETPGLYTVKLTCKAYNDVYYNSLEKTMVINIKDPLAGLSQVLYFTTRNA